MSTEWVGSSFEDRFINTPEKVFPKGFLDKSVGQLGLRAPLEQSMGTFT